RATVELLTGPVTVVEALADIPDECLALVPFRQVRERGFDCVDDGAPLTVLRIAERHELPTEEVLATLPDAPVTLNYTDPVGGDPVGRRRLSGGGFDVDDDTFASIVDTVLREEIGRGEGSNFVIHRVFEADLGGDPVAGALTVFRRLLTSERGA